MGREWLIENELLQNVNLNSLSRQIYIIRMLANDANNLTLTNSKMTNLTQSQKEELLKMAIESGASVEIVFTEETTKFAIYDAIESFEETNEIQISESDIEEIITSIPSKIGNYEVDAESRYFWKNVEQSNFVATLK